MHDPEPYSAVSGLGTEPTFDVAPHAVGQLFTSQDRLGTFGASTAPRFASRHERIGSG